MKKFPVISEQGNEYEVEILFGQPHTCEGMDVYIREERKGFLGMAQRKTVRLFQFIRGEEEALRGLGSHVEIAKYYVREYENERAEIDAYAVKRERSMREFVEWDGRC